MTAEYGALTVSVFEVTFPEKNDTEITNFCSLVCILGHIL